MGVSSGYDPSTGTMTLDGLTVSLLLSSILYIFCLAMVKRKLSFLHRVIQELTTKKLLVLSVGLVCLIRLMSFIGLAILDMANVSVDYSLKPVGDRADDDAIEDDRDQNFYDGAMTVLFDLPNSIVVSTYVLLTVVWAECFLVARIHTESTLTWRTRWLWAYLLFNFSLYGTQLILYIMIFFSVTTPVARTILYVVMTAVNFFAVFLVVCLYLVLGVKFSGFPYRSAHAKIALGKISSLLVLWSIARLIWGVALLLFYILDVELLQPDDSVWSALSLFFLFLFCEIIPILTLLDYSYMTIVGFERNASTYEGSMGNVGATSVEGALVGGDSYGESGADDSEKLWREHQDSFYASANSISTYGELKSTPELS